MKIRDLEDLIRRTEAREDVILLDPQVWDWLDQWEMDQLMEYGNVTWALNAKPPIVHQA